MHTSDQIVQLTYLLSSLLLNSVFMGTTPVLSTRRLEGRVSFIAVSQAHLFCQQTRMFLKLLCEPQGRCYKHNNVLSRDPFEDSEGVRCHWDTKFLVSMVRMSKGK